MTEFEYLQALKELERLDYILASWRKETPLQLAFQRRFFDLIKALREYAGPT